jgi:hypothetical protein
MDRVPKMIDYAGRFAFFEEACFAIVRDHGVHHLSRHRVAKVLGSSISTVRRLLSAEADLRSLALTEVGHRRRSGRYGRPPGEGLEAAAWVVNQLIPDSPRRIAEELVWWRLNLAAPTRATIPRDAVHLEEGPLHHRFAVAAYGFVPLDVLQLSIERPTAVEDANGDVDPVVRARTERDEVVSGAIEAACALIAPSLTEASRASAIAQLHALVEGLGVAVCLGRVAPEEAVGILRSQLALIVQSGAPDLT